MTPQIAHVFDEIRGAWRFRWIALAVSLLIALIGWMVIFSLPDRYAADARVFVDTRTALKPALQGLTIDQNVDAQINYVRDSLLEGPRLEKIAVDTGVLPAGAVDDRTRGIILDKLSNRIVLTAVSAGNQGDDRNTAGMIYGFHYMDPNREQALKVVDALLNTFVSETLGGKREGSEQAQKFLQSQIKDYEQRLSLAEDKLADFKKRNVGLMPSDQGGYFAQLQKETDDEKKAETDLSIAVSRRAELDKQIHSDSVVSAAGSGSNGTNGGGGGDTLSRIQETQARLDELLLKYTDQHPDVIATRATLAELKQRRTTELESLRRGDASAVATSGAGKNPVYQSMQLELNKVDVEIAAKRQELGQHQRTVTELRQHLNSAPQVEAEFQQLNRDYDVNKAQYTALQESFQKARLGERADTAGSVRFEVVMPPSAPIQPAWPSRMRLLGIIWLGSIVAGAAAAYGVHVMRPIVSSVQAINAMTNFPVLGVVGVAFPRRRRRQVWGTAWRFAFAGAALFALFVVVLALNVSGVRLSIHAIQALVKI